jgi:L,D-transpeptidase-like protein
LEENILEITEVEFPSKKRKLSRKNNTVLIIPLLMCAFFFAGFAKLNSNANEFAQERKNPNNKKPANYLALLTLNHFSENLRDTVYTDRNLYLELRIDQQMLYIHYKDGSTKKYPISSGNKFLNKGIESRPGLFAIFHKEELHLSSQFDDAKMFYYMPFNMGVGFHSLAGTGYYGNLGVRPSSHGCIRMRAEDVKTLFHECEIGTIVLAHRGKTARVVAFAPEGFRNDRGYTKDEYMEMLAYNLNSVYEGKYFISQPKRFIIDPAIIPRIGYNVGSSDDIPAEQQVPFVINHFEVSRDKIGSSYASIEDIKETLDWEVADNFQFSDDDAVALNAGIDVSKELVNKLAYNPIGILPYFPPDK